MARSRSLLAASVVLFLAIAGLFAQPKIDLPQQPAGGTPKVALPGAPAPAGTARVEPGPEPWYTVFGTGEVIGYIEPCG